MAGGRLQGTDDGCTAATCIDGRCRGRRTTAGDHRRRHVQKRHGQCAVEAERIRQEGLAVASIARDVVEMTPPRDDNAR